ncbi:MAG: GNAT family N-acetyltransferase [Longicatena caecimuris]|uniref:GNAT family N-acetyltransferase n=1 Tax=Longicatena caecimuris TaxID=1796635 RepID=UPI00399366A2
MPYERRGEPQAWCVLDKQRGKVIGHVCFHALEDDTAQLAYVLHPEYWGHGYIREALLPLLEVGFTQFGLRRITAMVAYENKRSAKVLEALGFRLEGICKEAMKLSDGIYHDMMLYAILKKEWRKLYEQNT